MFLPKRIFFQDYLKTPEKSKLNFSRSALFHTKPKECPKYFAENFMRNSFASKLP